MKASDIAAESSSLLMLIEDDIELNKLEPNEILQVLKSATSIVDNRIQVAHQFEMMKATFGLMSRGLD